MRYFLKQINASSERLEFGEISLAATTSDNFRKIVAASVSASKKLATAICDVDLTMHRTTLCSTLI